MHLIPPRRTWFGAARVLGLSLLVGLSVAGCGGFELSGSSGSSLPSGSIGPGSPPGTGGGLSHQYFVGGSVSGLTGSGLILQDTVSGNQVTVPANASAFAITPAVNTGATYNVVVLTQPATPSQTCTVTSGSGTVGVSNVTSVVVTCATNSYTIGGSITGLTGTGLVLQDTVSGNQVTVPANASTFTITPAVSSGATYNVAATGQPNTPTQTCTVTAGAGTVGASNVTSVVVTCTTNTYTVGGSITGLTGTGLVLQDTVSGNQVTVPANATSFTITPGIPSGSSYSVVAQTQPGNPKQLCRVTNGTGMVTIAAITSVAVNCVNVGQFLWVTNPFDSNGDGSIDAFTINPATGALTAVSGFPAATNTTTDNQPFALVLDPSGQSLYVANSGIASNGPPQVTSATVATDSVNPTTGALTQDVSALNLGSPNQPCSLAVDAATSGTYLYVGAQSNANGTFSSSIQAYSLAGGVGSAPLAGSPYAAVLVPCGLAVDSTKSYLFVTTEINVLSEFGINADGSLNPLPGYTFPNTNVGTNGVAVSPIARFIYVTDGDDNTVVALSYDGTGTLTPVNDPNNPYPVGNVPEGITVDPTGKFLYVSNSVDGTVSAFTINVDGSLSAVNGGVAYVSAAGFGVPSTYTPTTVQVDPSSQFLYVANGDAGTITPFTIGANGALTPVAGGPVSTVMTLQGGPSSIAIK